MNQENHVTTQDKRELRWMKMYSLYIEFKQEFGRGPKTKETYKGEKLGMWVSNQRRADRNNACSKIRKEKLADTVQESQGLENNLKKMIKLYQAFIKEYHREPSYNEVYQGENLGRWLKDQKARAKKGELSIKRQNQLVNAGVVLFEDAKEKRWNEACSFYIEYVQKYGRGSYANEKYNNINLGWWVKKQRYRLEKEKELLKQQYKAFLSKNGYRKDPLDIYWKTMYGFCLKFIHKYNRLPKNNEQYWGKPLGCWFFYQNKLRKYNWLSDEQINLLNQLQEEIKHEEPEAEIKIPVGKHQEKWGKACILYVEYVQKNGCGPDRNEIYKKVKLGQWVSVQRQYLKKERELLQQRYQALLIEKGYSEDPLELYWEEMYSLCCEFVQINKRKPKNGEVYSDKPLGNWLTYQDKLMKYNCLSEDQYRRLTLLHV